MDPGRLHDLGDLSLLAAGRPAGDLRHHVRTGTVLQAKQNINYIRNSVKATVDAYDGTVTLYEFDETDPILKAWNQAFGGDLIKPRRRSRRSWRPLPLPRGPVQGAAGPPSRFHVGDPKAFNSRQDFWQVPDDPAR